MKLLKVTFKDLFDGLQSNSKLNKAFLPLLIICLVIYIPSLYYKPLFTGINNLDFSHLFAKLRGDIVLSNESNVEIYFRIFNIFIHFVNTLVISVLSVKIFERCDFPKFNIQAGSFVAALTFCLHPMQIESIMLLSNTKSLLASSFAILFILRNFEEQSSDHFESAGIDTLSVIFYLMAIMFDISFGLLSLWILLIDTSLLRMSFAKAIQRFFFLLLFAWIYYSISFYGSTFDVSSKATYSLGSALLAFEKILIPINLHFVYASNRELGLSSLLFPSFVVLALSSLFISFEKVKKGIFPVLCLFGSLIIIFSQSFLTNHGHNDEYFIADRMVYLSLFPVSLIVGYLFSRAKKFQPFVIILLIFFSALSMERISNWKSLSSLLAEDIDQILPSSRKMEVFGSNLRKLYTVSLMNKIEYEKALSLVKEFMNDGRVSAEFMSYLFKIIINFGSFKDATDAHYLIQKIEESPMMPLFTSELFHFYYFIGDYEKTKDYYILDRKNKGVSNPTFFGGELFWQNSLVFAKERLIDYFIQKKDARSIEDLIENSNFDYFRKHRPFNRSK